MMKTIDMLRSKLEEFTQEEKEVIIFSGLYSTGCRNAVVIDNYQLDEKGCGLWLTSGDYEVTAIFDTIAYLEEERLQGYNTFLLGTQDDWTTQISFSIPFH